ncbi:MAG: hypothetical protein ASARMPRED_009288 [Alectoria sarmentosa]|nr:MAG: hypothetical protein ASARMPRED_009288 [Alectoria sarmentosa]
MPFLSFQQSSWKNGYLLGEQSDDEDSDVFEKSRASLPERRSSIPRLLLISPARKFMDYRLTGPISTYPNGYHKDPFFGDPSPGLDQRWIDRLRHATIRLSPEEFSHYNQSGILLGDESGYLATPTAYHDLHCIRFFHKTVYPDYYFPNDSEKKQLGRDTHARHCLHNLYHSLTCNADMTIRVMRWHPNGLLPSPVDHEHECMDWDRIDEWAKERYVDTATPGLLVHPTRGEVFPGGKYLEHDEE